MEKYSGGLLERRRVEGQSSLEQAESIVPHLTKRLQSFRVFVDRVAPGIEESDEDLLEACHKQIGSILLGIRLRREALLIASRGDHQRLSFQESFKFCRPRKYNHESQGIEAREGKRQNTKYSKRSRKEEIPEESIEEL